MRVVAGLLAAWVVLALATGAMLGWEVVAIVYAVAILIVGPAAIWVVWWIRAYPEHVHRDVKLSNARELPCARVHR